MAGVVVRCSVPGGPWTQMWEWVPFGASVCFCACPSFVYSPPCYGVSVVYIADVCDVLSLLPLLLLLLRVGLLIQIARYDCAVEHSLS